MSVKRVALQDRIKDTHLIDLLKKQGIDKDYVELSQDYAPRSLGKEHSPYARFYKDRKSNKKVMVVSILPHVTADGHKIECGWLPIGNKYHSKINLFKAIVRGRQIKVTTLSDQPDGRKKNDSVTWNPQLFLNGIEQSHGNVTLLQMDTQPHQKLKQELARCPHLYRTHQEPASYSQSDCALF